MSDDAPLAGWQQGDVCREVASIPYLADLDTFEERPTPGAVVVSQTCDVVRDIATKSSIQLAALIEANPDEWGEIAKFGRPRYAVVPALRKERLVADLDTIVTVEKAGLASFQPLRGCLTISDQQAFAYALARHRNRFAFPDACSQGLSKLRNWVKTKGKTTGSFGSFLNGVEQFRVWADNFEAPSQVEILCILDGDPDSDLRETWIKDAIPKIGDLIKVWCTNNSVIVQTADELTLADYRRFVRLDFDALTLIADEGADAN